MTDRSKILIVDDRPENIFSLKKTLSATDAEVISALNGNDALTATLNHDFALAVLDVQMPGMDGYELAELLRSEKKTRQMPIIFVSAVYMSVEHVFKGYDSGAVDFLIKPFEARILISKVEVFLQLHHQKRKLEASEKLIRDQYNELQASERRFETLVNTVPDIVYRIDPKGYFTFVNDAIEKLGYNPEELIGSHFSRIILPVELAGISRDTAIQSRQASEEPGADPLRLFDERRTGKRKTTGLEIRLIPKAGARGVTGVLQNLGDDSAIVEVNSSGFYSDQIEEKNKVFLGTVGVIRDITDRKKLEEGLKKAKEELESKVDERTLELTEKNRALILEVEKRKKAEIETRNAKQDWEDVFNAIGHMAMVLDKAHRIIAVNQSTLEHTGKSPEDLIGQKCHTVFHHSDTMDEKCPVAGSSDILDRNIAEVRFAPLDKSFIVSCTPIYDHTGDINKIIHIMTDISDRKRLEKELLQAHKMEAIGTLAGGIAHDFNNILTSLLGYAQIMISEVEKGTTMEKDLSEIYNAGLRAKELVRQILTFARKTEEEMMPIRIDLIIKEVIKFIRSSIPATISIKENIRSRSKVFANATQIHQVIMNLCTNASHAMDARGGMLTIELLDFHQDHAEVVSGQRVAPGDYIRLIVTDTGTGIPADIMERIFEPYFTTKSGEEGTGMGLALVQGIVKEAKGVIQVESDVKKGSRFEILLPTTQKDQVGSSSLQPKEPVTGSGAILFVDDEVSITRLTKRVLETFGYTVTTSNNPLEALAVFEKAPHMFDMVISDLTMPDMKGDRFLQEILRLRPDIPCALSTGYSRELTEKSGTMQGVKAVLIKPLEKNQLVSTIQQILHDNAGPGEPVAQGHEMDQDTAGIPRGKGETVLIVEDEPPVLKLAGTVLKTLGYKVLTAADPKKALVRAQQYTDHIHLLLTDVVMQEMNGRELAEHLHSLRPDTKVMYMSGYSANVIADTGVLANGAAFIAKPFAVKDMAQKLREVLDGRG